MPISLNDAQLRELDQSVSVITLEDPRNHNLFVLIPWSDFQRVQSLLSQPNQEGKPSESVTPTDRRAKLVHALRYRTPEMEKRLSELKQAGTVLRKRTDLVWYLLLEAASTLGNSRGYAGLFGNKPLLDSVSYAVLKLARPEGPPQANS